MITLSMSMCSSKKKKKKEKKMVFQYVINISQNKLKFSQYI